MILSFLLTELGDVCGGNERQILVRAITEGRDELGGGGLVFLQGGGRHRALPEACPTREVVLGRVRFEPPTRLGFVDIGDHPPRLRLREVCF